MSQGGGRAFRVVVAVMLKCLLIGGCIGESRLTGAAATELVESSETSANIARLQGRWTGRAEIGWDEIPEVVEFYRSTTSVTVNGERSPVAIFDVLESGTDWVRILVKHPARITVTTVRFRGPDSFWLEHYPNTAYTRAPHGGPSNSAPEAGGER